METLSYPGKFLLQVTKKQYTDMAKIVDNPKRFKVIELSRNELAKIGGMVFAIDVTVLLILAIM